MPGIRSRPHTAAIAAALACLAVAAATGCSGSDSHSADPTSAKTSRPASSRPTGTVAGTVAVTADDDSVQDDSVQVAPRIPNEVRHLASATSEQGSAAVTISELPAGPVAIMVNCQGNGVISLAVADISLTISCAEEVSGTYNVINLKSSRGAAAISVTANSTIRWSLSVGTVPAG